MSLRSENREASTLIQKRLDSLNECLHIITSGSVVAIPVLAMNWKIVPAMNWDSLPLKCRGLELGFNEEIITIRSGGEVRLVCRRFCYKLEAKSSITDHNQRRLNAGWQFRYELDDRGPVHSFANACTASALVTATTRRLPAFHMHVKEMSDLDDSLHYPISEPSEPPNIIFNVIRLIKDEFI